MDSTKFPTIYDVTLAVHPRDGGPATISSILLGRKTVAEAYIRKYNLADVPKVQLSFLFIWFSSLNPKIWGLKRPLSPVSPPTPPQKVSPQKTLYHFP